MRYFDRYVKLVESKKVPVCYETELAIKRVQQFKKQYTFKQKEADKRINFIGNE